MPRSLLVTGGAGFIGTNFIHYGPFQFPEKLFPLMIVNALAGRPMPVYGDGLNVRDLEEGFGERWGGISITRNGGAGYWTAAIRNGSGTITVLPCPSDPYVIHLRPLGLLPRRYGPIS